MKKLSILFFLISLSSFSQRKIKGNISSDFTRPSVTFIYTTLNNNYIERSSGFNAINLSYLDSSSLGKVINTNSSKFIHSKFINVDVFNLDYTNLKSKGVEFYAINNGEDLNDLIKKVVEGSSGKFISSIFNLKNGEVDFKKLEERSMKSMTEDQRFNYINSLKGLDISSLDNLPKKILNHNYIVLINEFKKLNNKSKYNWYVYKINVGEGKNIEERISNWDNKFRNNYNEMLVSNFPVELISSGKFKMNNSKSNTDLVNKSIIKSSKKITVFRPKSRVLDNLNLSLGSKEGLRVDDIFVSYLELEDENGLITGLKKVGVDRVKSVGNNNVNLLDLNQKPERTKLYADGRRSTKKGMVSIKKREIGLGISGFVTENSGLRLDYRTKLWPNTFIYVESENWTGDSFYWGDNATGSITHLGFQKSYNIGRKFQLSFFFGAGLIDEIDLDGENFSVVKNMYTGYDYFQDDYLGFDTLKWLEEKNNSIEEEPGINIVSVGTSFSVKFGSIQFMPKVRYIISAPEKIYTNEIQIGGAIRYNF